MNGMFGKIKYNKIVLIILLVFEAMVSYTQTDTSHPLKFKDPKLILKPANGFKSIWYMIGPTGDDYKFKYSGGMGTYPANHRPFAVYAPEVKKTFFCFGGTNDSNTVLYHNVSYYDHVTGKVANPTIILNKGTIDAHDNPVISLDDSGYVWVYSTSHGTARPSYISRSENPYDIAAFKTIHATEIVKGKVVPFTNFSYLQIYHVKGKGFFGLFTRYSREGHRVIGFNTSKDGVAWNEWKMIAHIEQGHYQISTEANGKIGVAFDYHPLGKGLDYRTNLYYIETNDWGKTWTTASRQIVVLPVTTIENPAKIIDYANQKLNSYLLDIAFDRNAHPYILTINSKGAMPGPLNNPRNWIMSVFDGMKWNNNIITQSDNNYDMGSIYFEDNTVQVIAPTENGPQLYNPGGEIIKWISLDKGKTWKKGLQLTKNSLQNHNYVRKPLHVQSDFYGFWTDGNGRIQSPSSVYFMNQKGDVFKLPYHFSQDMILPEKVEKNR